MSIVSFAPAVLHGNKFGTTGKLDESLVNAYRPPRYRDAPGR